ncbi:MAG: hypothetical protein IJP03_03450 [Christensenellaceae bacterium]|nr:hypothetical protein [Christensenellaceae bacterium]
MGKVKIGLICVSLQGERTDLAQDFLRRARETISQTEIELFCADEVTLDGQQVKDQQKAIEAAGADAIIYMCGTWLLSTHIVDAAKETKLPIAVWGLPEPISFSSVGCNAVHGTLDEMGIAHKLLHGMPEDEKVKREICAFAKAAWVRRKLACARMGIIGGRAICAYPTAADPNQVKAVFGTEVEHIDQLLVLEKARGVPDEKAKKWMEETLPRYGKVEAKEETLLKSAKIYFALKEIAEEHELNMLSIKCIGEFLDAYASCCLPLSVLNDEGLTVQCQCNINALLSGYIMNLLSGGPSYFGDINTVDEREGIARLINCGSIPGKLAQSHKDIHVVEQYDYMGLGGGACTLFCMKEGRVTFGTLGRVEGQYVMSIAGGEAFVQPKEVLTPVRSWAQGFVKLDCDPVVFYRNIRCNHSVVAYGDYREELKEICRQSGIFALENE